MELQHHGTDMLLGFSQEPVSRLERTFVNTPIAPELTEKREWLWSRENQRQARGMQKILATNPHLVPVIDFIGLSNTGKSTIEAFLSGLNEEDPIFLRLLTEKANAMGLMEQRKALGIHITLGLVQDFVAKRHRLKDKSLLRPEHFPEVSDLQQDAVIATRNAFFRHPSISAAVYREGVVITRNGARGRKAFQQSLHYDPHHRVVIIEATPHAEDAGLESRGLILANPKDPTIDQKLAARKVLGTTVAGRAKQVANSFGHRHHWEAQWKDVLEQLVEAGYYQEGTQPELDVFLSHDWQETRLNQLNDWMKNAGLDALGFTKTTRKKIHFLENPEIEQGVHADYDRLLGDKKGNNSHQFPYRVLYDNRGRRRSPHNITAEEIQEAMALAA